MTNDTITGLVSTAPSGPVSRRDALGLAALAGAAGMTLSSTLAAAAGEHDDHAGHGAAGHGGYDGHAHHAMGATHKALIDTATDCLAEGEVCIAHCITSMRGGSTELSDCLASVHAMLPMCAALQRLAALDSKRLKALVAVCKDVCADCEEVCRKHAEKHAVCKACAESCAACIKACKAALDA